MSNECHNSLFKKRRNLPGYGTLPIEKISQSKIPYDQTSDSVDKIRYVRDSGAIHLMGIGACICSKIFTVKTLCSRKWLNYLSLFLVITFVVHFARHSEIGHFDDSVIRQQNISGGQVAVKNLNKMGNSLWLSVYTETQLQYLFARQIIHPSGDLERPRNEIACRNWLKRFGVWYQISIRVLQTRNWWSHLGGHYLLLNAIISFLCCCHISSHVTEFIYFVYEIVSVFHQIILQIAKSAIFKDYQ